jgi:hypothetical protein
MTGNLKVLIVVLYAPNLEVKRLCAARDRSLPIPKSFSHNFLVTPRSLKY